MLVSAAASLADALGEAAAAWRRETGSPVDLNLAGSNTLAQQLLAGAPSDLFVSADRAQVDRLVAAGRADAGDVVALCGNRLVVVTPAAAGAAELTGPADLLAFARLSLADPEAVPAGVYARRWLEREGLWRRLAPRVVPALDVRAALAAVAAGYLPAGVVYATDAATSERVAVVYRVPADRAPPIEYFAVPVAGGRRPAADAFLRFLQGPEGRAIFERRGFTVPAMLPPTPLPTPAP